MTLPHYIIDIDLSIVLGFAFLFLLRREKKITSRLRKVLDHLTTHNKLLDHLITDDTVLSKKVDLDKWLKEENWNIMQASCICAGYEPPKDITTNIISQIGVCYKNPDTKYFVNLFGQEQSYGPDYSYTQINFISLDKDVQPIVTGQPSYFINLAINDKSELLNPKIKAKFRKYLVLKELQNRR